MKKKIKLNLGCASRPLKGYINIDIDSKETIIKRYPNIDIPEDLDICQYDIFNLPYEDSSVNEILSDCMLEHLSFLEEKKFFLEMKRVLSSNGRLLFTVPDFENTIELWIKAKDDWKEFFRNDDEAITKEHWFGNYSYSCDNRWGYLTASIFGPQNGEGQFHKNAYTEGKIRSMLEYLEFDIIELSRYKWKDDREMMLKVIASKR
ncbi:MAG: methyltransferase domain-containing protein [Gammaproteobacteria bacterium]|nr:methyltransferase domain-containing protein [Gammaproteobacteria bacterium]